MEKFEQTIAIEAPPAEVWRTLTEPARVAPWMVGARVESNWQLGSDIHFRVELNGQPFHDHGTILAIDPERLLSFDHWSEVSRLPDTPESRTLMTFELAPTSSGTALTFRHERLRRGTIAKHARFFWGSALLVLKDVAEGRWPI